MNPPIPRILLVEDDPSTGTFLASALEAIPAEVTLARDGATARACVRKARFDLWLVDANLPDGAGAALLADLRRHAPGVPALAHTADPDPATHAALRRAGFAAVLPKPLPVRALQDAVRVALDLPSPADLAGGLLVWDDPAAARALHGRLAHVATLRKLLRAELGRQRDEILAALDRHDTAAARAELHRLKASCGFVGAAQLAAAVQRLDAAPTCAMARSDFEAAVAGVLASA